MQIMCPLLIARRCIHIKTRNYQLGDTANYIMSPSTHTFIECTQICCYARACPKKRNSAVTHENGYHNLKIIFLKYLSTDTSCRSKTTFELKKA